MKGRLLYVSVMIFFAVFLTAGSLSAQDAEVSADAEALSESQAGLVSFDFKDADVRNVLRIFSHKTGINIVASPDVQGNVTVKLNNVPWEKALKIILEMNDFAYIREGNVIKVLSKAKMAEEPLKTEVIALDYAKVVEVKLTLDQMVTERGNIQTDERANLLIITDVPSAFPELEKVIKRLDIPTPQVRIESKIIETTFDVTRNFGVRWGFLDGYEVGATAFNHTWRRTLSDTWETTVGNEDGTELIEDAISYVNPSRREHNSDASGYVIPGKQLYEYREPDWLYNGSSTFTRTLTDGYNKENKLNRGKSTTETFSVGANGINFVMSALMQDVGTDILSAPSIVTLDNKEAEIKVAQDYPIPNYQYNDDTGQFTLSGFDSVEIGITMLVTPHVSPNGYVTLELNPKVTRNEGTIRFGVEGSEVPVPVVGNEEVKTSVLVKDGDTIVLGGLMKQFDDYDKQNVPVLHSIPVLGWLFKAEDKKIEKRNLLVFVTPTIIKKENITAITQDSADWYTKDRESNIEPTTIYPDLDLLA